jgi:hypothetical protein
MFGVLGRNDIAPIPHNVDEPKSLSEEVDQLANKVNVHGGFFTPALRILRAEIQLMEMAVQEINIQRRRTIEFWNVNGRSIL